MWLTFLAFVKEKTTIIGIATAVMFQLIFGVVWITAYRPVTNNLAKLHVVLVNEDHKVGKQLANQFLRTLPYHTDVTLSLTHARNELTERKAQMVIVIPSDFTSRLENAGHPTLRYILNESNSSMVKSIMTETALQATLSVNELLMARYIHLHTPSILPKVEIINPVDRFSTQMIPLMLVLASFVGAMIMGMNIHQSSRTIASRFNKWHRIAARLWINVLASLMIGLVGSSLVRALDGLAHSGFFENWLFQSLFILVFSIVTQSALILFDLPGMLINIALLSTQLVSSGAMVPRELLPRLFVQLSAYLPATYAVDGNMNLMFGGPSAMDDGRMLVIIMCAALAITVLGVTVRREHVTASTNQRTRNPIHLL